MITAARNRWKNRPRADKLLLLSALLSILLSSCIAPLYYEKTEPPEIATEIKPCRIAFVNIFNYTLPEVVRVENQNVYRISINKFGSELASLGSTDSLFKFFVGDTLFKGVPVEDQTLLLPVDTVQRLTTVFRSDYLLTLDSLSLFLQEDESDESDGGTYQIAFKNFYLVADYYITLYSLSGDLVNRSQVTVTSKYGNRLVFSGLFSSFSRAAAQAADLGTEAADEYTDKFYPVKIQDQRYIYAGRKLGRQMTLLSKKNGIKLRRYLSILQQVREPDWPKNQNTTFLC